jgi:hypothetical protein
LQKVYEDTKTSKETIRSYSSIESMQKALPNKFPEYYKRYNQDLENIRSIIPHTELAKEMAKSSDAKTSTLTLIDKEKFSFTPEINIYDNKIALLSCQEKFGIIIESEELASAFKKIFELSWLGAKSIK